MKLSAARSGADAAMGRGGSRDSRFEIAFRIALRLAIYTCAHVATMELSFHPLLMSMRSLEKVALAC